MSTNNSIAPSGREQEVPDNGSTVKIPEDLAARYQVRTIEPVQGSARRVGLFVPDDRTNPAIEITGERIVARKEDAETVASLVKLAQHNGWDKVDVEGSPEFRKAMWDAGTRAGLSVSGYEPSFAELEQVEAKRREDTLRRERETARQSSSENQAEVRDNVERTVEVVEAASEIARERASSAPQPSGQSPAREDRAAPSDEQRPQVEPEIRASRAEQEQRAPRAARDEGEDLADLFLNGPSERQTAEPRLRNALDAQASMERNIAELFKDDPSQIPAANLESRHMISDVLRRGLDVSVREPTPVRQIEPAHSPDMER